MTTKLTIIMLTLALCLFKPLSPSFAEDSSYSVQNNHIVTIDSSDNNTGNSLERSLSLEEAISLAMVNNTSVKIAEEDRKKADLEASQATLTSKDIKGALNLSRAQSKYLNEKQKSAALEIAEYNYKVVLEQVKLTVIKCYNTVLEDQELVDVQKKALKRAQKQLEQAQTMFNVGTAAKTDILSAQVNFANVQTEKIAAENDLKIAFINLNKIIGIDLNTQLSLTTKASKEDTPEIDLLKSISDALLTRQDVLAAKSNLEVAEEAYKITVDYTASNTYAAKIALTEKNKASITLDNTKLQVVKDLIQAYLNIKSADITVKNLETAVEQANENVRLTNLRYNVGMATSIEVMDASIKLSDTESSYVKSIHALNLAKLIFETAKLAPLP